MHKLQPFHELVKSYTSGFNPVVPFNKKLDKLLQMNFTECHTGLTEEILKNTIQFSDYVQSALEKAEAKYGIGGYNEHRTIYSRSEHFNEGVEITSPLGEQEAEPRRLHLGIDIWGEANTPVYAPMHGIVHSFNFNNIFGDYGATLILHHTIKDFSFHTLYGHLNLKSIENLKRGETIEKGQWIAGFGKAEENGHWPPHLHFQIIINMQGLEGDYPGVCKYSERESYLANCPDPDLILGMMQYAI